MADGKQISVTVLYSPVTREVQEWELALPAGASVLHALRASGIDGFLPAAQLVKGPLGIWGRVARLDTILEDLDRVEVYRPLQVDPKLARRERFRKQGVRAAGLFARHKAPGDAAS